MRIKITGINGYVGQLLLHDLQKKGYLVSGIQRKLLYGDIKYLKEELCHSDVVINLAGSSILKRWTRKNMKRIFSSRVITSQNLVSAVNDLPEDERPRQIISASAIGIYKNGVEHDESSTTYNDGFIGQLVKDWEESYLALPVEINLSLFRIGLVIGKKSQTIKKMLPAFKTGLGATIGSGKQAFPFIHEKDLVKAFEWAIEHPPKHTIYNLVAPTAINNKKFTETLSEKLDKPALFRIPPLALRLLFGKASVMMLKSPVVNPKALLNEGFDFNFPTIDAALDEILS